MSSWSVAVVVLLAVMVGPLFRLLRGRDMDAVVAVEMISTLSVAVMFLLAEVDGDPALADAGLVTALLAFGGGLVYVRFLERWI